MSSPCRTLHSPRLAVGIIALALMLFLGTDCLAQYSPDAQKKIEAALEAFGKQRYQEARTLFDEALEKEQAYKPTVDDYLRDVALQLQYKNPDAKAAMEAVNKAMEVDRKNPKVYIYRGYVYDRIMDDPRRALEDFKRAIDLEWNGPVIPEEVRKHSESVQVTNSYLVKKRELNLLVELLTPLLEKDPKNEQLLRCLGSAYRNLGQKTNAARMFAVLVQQQPDEFQYHEIYAGLLAPEDALRVYQGIYQKDKARLSVRLQLAELYLEVPGEDNEEVAKDRRAKAVELLLGVADGDIQTLDIRLRLAGLLGKAEQFKAAADQYSRAARELPPRAQSKSDLDMKEVVFFDLGKMLVLCGKGSQALPYLLEAQSLHWRTEVDPEPTIVFYLGRAYHLTGDKSNAELCFRQVQDQMGKRRVDLDIADFLSQIYLDDKDYAKACEILRRAVNEDPKAVRFRQRYALALHLRGDWSECIKQIESSNLADHKEFGIEARLLLARAYLKSHQPDRAIPILRKLEKFPTWKGYALRLLPPTKELTGIPTSGKNQIVLVLVNDVIHLRIFDAGGMLVLNTDGAKLKDQGGQVEELCGLLQGSKPEDLRPEDKQRVLAAVLALVGPNPWNDEGNALMGNALLQMNSTEEALRYMEKASVARPNDEELKLDYAKALSLAGRRDNASGLYAEVSHSENRSLAAAGFHGLGDMAMKEGEESSGDKKIQAFKRAVENYKKAFELEKSPDEMSFRDKAERELSKAEADLAAQTEKAEAEARARVELRRSYLYIAGILFAFSIPVGGFWLYYRRQWATRCYQQVVELEKDLKELIRSRVRVLWGGRWDPLASDPFQGRVDYKYLRRKASEKHITDILEVANFGHLVGIIDSGWEVLGFDHYAIPGTRALTIAGLSYVGNCRNAIFHSTELENLQQPSERRGRRSERPQNGLRPLFEWFEALAGGNLNRHLDRQVTTSIRAIRKNFDIGQATVAAEDAIPEVEAHFVPDPVRAEPEAGRDKGKKGARGPSNRFTVDQREEQD